MLASTAPDPRSLFGRWRGLPAPLKDIALSGLVTVLAFTPTVSHIGPEIGDLPASEAGAATGLVLTLAMCLPLAVRTRLPAVCLAIVGGAFAVDQVLGHPDTFGKVSLLLSLYAAGSHLRHLRGWFGAAMTAGYVALALVLHDLGSPQNFLDFLAFYSIMTVIWLTGSGVRRWRAEEAEHRRLAADVAAVAERARIARELHDVVTHHVTAMVIQADASQFLLDTGPSRARDGLTAISDTGRRALTELRALLNVLEATGESAASDRTPALGKIVDLVEQARLAGQPVEWTEQGEQRPQSVDVELATYRVVQEALTNALKHATGRPTTVLIRHGDSHVEIDVTTAGPARSTPATPSGGRGLTGLRERVRMLRGELTTSGQPDGGFRLKALIPLQP